MPGHTHEDHNKLNKTAHVCFLRDAWRGAQGVLMLSSLPPSPSKDKRFKNDFTFCEHLCCMLYYNAAAKDFDRQKRQNSTSHDQGPRGSH